MKNLKKLAVMAALIGATHGAKAFEKDFEPVSKEGEAQGIELINGQLMVKSDGAKIGGVNTPYVFVSTNKTDFAQNGFAVKQMADANSVLLDGNDIYFTRDSDTNHVYCFTVKSRKGLNGIGGQLQKFESQEAISDILGVKEGVVYVKNTSDEVVELAEKDSASQSSSSSYVTIPDSIADKPYSVVEDDIYFVDQEKRIVSKYNISNTNTTKIIVSGFLKDHTAQSIVAFDDAHIFILDTEGGLHLNEGASISTNKVEKIAASKDQKNLVITSVDENNQKVLSLYSLASQKMSDAKRPCKNTAVIANRSQYYVSGKKIGYRE